MAARPRKPQCLLRTPGAPLPAVERLSEILAEGAGGETRRLRDTRVQVPRGGSSSRPPSASPVIVATSNNVAAVGRV